MTKVFYDDKRKQVEGLKAIAVGLIDSIHHDNSLTHDEKARLLGSFATQFNIVSVFANSGYELELERSIKSNKSKAA